MDTDEEFTALGLPLEKRQLPWEARARIIWGERLSDVQQWLELRGIEPLTANRIVTIATRERSVAIRALGMIDLAIGLPVLAAGVALWLGKEVLEQALPLRWPWAPGMRRGRWVVGLSLLAVAYGGYRTWRGLTRVFGGSHVEGSVADMGE